MNPTLIEWLDSAQPIAGWRYLNDPPPLEVVSCVSVGWLIQENEQAVMLAPNLGDHKSYDGAQGSGFIRIPKAAITRRVLLHEINGASSAAPSSRPATKRKRRAS